MFGAHANVYLGWEEERKDVVDLPAPVLLLPGLQVIGNSHEYSILSVVVHRDGRLSLTDRFSGSQGRQIPNLSGIRISRTRLAVYRDLLFTSGHWDGSFKIFNVKEGTPVVSMWRHNDRVTCIDVSENGKLAVTGSKVWYHLTSGIVSCGCFYAYLEGHCPIHAHSRESYPRRTRLSQSGN